ncbi:DUF3793 family protein [Anaerosporobacter faecicola]|uniref:DUF3793 family protein n=1 Tax=Anaerosporobacter faecicola TaxID=2718714 RepID=UPI00143879FD|nr:DUF3793 family protein [Anaerosporobacter faecicola]
MSQELLQMIYSLNQEDITTQLALQCAPVLTGIKMSNLFIIHNSYGKMIYDIFKNSPISISVICRSADKTTYLLYNKEKIVSYLSETKVQELMHILGYKKVELYAALVELRGRYTAYKEQSKPFPHELGILLGYPVEDVIGFIQNKGKNFLYTGYWKVYENLPETLKIFQLFHQARENVLKMLTQGVTIQSILSQYYYTEKVESASFI